MGLFSYTNEIILNDINRIIDNVDKIVQYENDEQKEAQINHDTICPHCQKSGDIVNRFALVHGNTDTDVIITHSGPHNMVNNMTIKTDAVNHCNNCGNEWEKYKIISINRTLVIKMALIYLIEIMNDWSNMKIKHKYETLEIFEDCYYESIIMLYNSHKKNINKRLPKSKLKKYFKTLKNSNPEKTIF